MKERGLILRPSELRPYRYAIDPAYLRYCVLYWDKIDCPDAAPLEAPFVSNRSDLVFLQELGFLQRTRGFFYSTDANGSVRMRTYDEYPEHFWTIAQVYAFMRNNEGNEVWHLGNSGTLFRDFPTDTPEHFFFVERPPFREGQTGNVLALRDAPALAKDRGLTVSPSIEVELFESLPVPAIDVGIEEVIAFKEDRKDELTRLRHAIDGLCVHILDSRDIPRAKNHAIDKIGQSISDLEKIMKNRGWKRITSSLGIKIDISKLVFQSLMGGFVGSSVDLPLVGAAIGAATSVIRFSFDPKALKPEAIPDDLRDYQYAWRVSAEMS